MTTCFTLIVELHHTTSPFRIACFIFFSSYVMLWYCTKSTNCTTNYPEKPSLPRIFNRFVVIWASSHVPVLYWKKKKETYNLDSEKRNKTIRVLYIGNWYLFLSIYLLLRLHTNTECVKISSNLTWSKVDNAFCINSIASPPPILPNFAFIELLYTYIH